MLLEGSSTSPHKQTHKSNKEKKGGISWKKILTFEKWRYVPYRDASSLHELPQRNFQEEDGNPTKEGNKNVRDEEHTCSQVSNTK